MPNTPIPTAKEKIGRLLSDYFDHASRASESRTVAAEDAVLTLPAISAAELDAGIRMIELAQSHGLDVRNIYCTKTGQPIGTRNTETLAMLCKIYKTDDIVSLWPYIEQNSIAPHWIKTDPAGLDALITHDPRGYFIYALSSIYLHCNPAYDTNKRFWTDPAAARAWTFEKILAYRKAQEIDETSIRACAEVLLDFLRLINPRTMRHKLRLPHVATMADLISAENVAEWPEIFSRIAHHVITTARVTNLSNGLTLSGVRTSADLLALRDALGAGGTAFAGQRRSNTLSPVDDTMRLLKNAGLDLSKLAFAQISYARDKANNPETAGRRKRYQNATVELRVEQWARTLAKENNVSDAGENPAADVSPARGSFLAMMARGAGNKEG